MTRQRGWLWALYIGLYVVATVAFNRLTRNPDIRIAHGILTYLLLIIGASRQGGRALSATMVLLSYLAVDYYFVPPRRQFGASTELNWLIMIGFALTGLLITALFDQLQRAVSVARERTLEVERLSAERIQLERDAATARVLVEADRLKNALLISLAHDLRSPVATLALLSDPAAGFPHAHAMQRVSDESRRLGDFITTLQRFATASGTSALQLDAHDAVGLVQTALRTGEALLSNRTVRVHSESPSSSGAILARCDHTLTVQVLGNLLQNAVRYSSADHAIDVFCIEHAEHVEIVVADRGPGLNDADLERLFTPLRRTPTVWTDAENQEARMGMGLSIARTFARAQSGDVVYRTREGGGSLFAIRLPRAVT